MIDPEKRPSRQEMLLDECEIANALTETDWECQVASAHVARYRLAAVNSPRHSRKAPPHPPRPQALQKTPGELPRHLPSTQLGTLQSLKEHGSAAEERPIGNRAIAV